MSKYLVTESQLIPAGKIATQSYSRILVCGGRTFGWTSTVDPNTDPKEWQKRKFEQEFLYDVLDEFHKVFGFSELAHGDATGADKLCSSWALHKAAVGTMVAVHRYPADWNKHHDAAGPIRNKIMLERFMPDVVLAFPGGKGTDNMKKISREHGVRVLCPEK